MSLIVAEQNGYTNAQFLFANLRLEKFTVSPYSDTITARNMITNFVNGIKSNIYIRKKTPLCRWCNFEVVCHYEEPVNIIAQNWFDIREVK